MCYRFIYSLTKLGDEPDTCLMAVPIRPRARFAHITHITYNWGPPRAITYRYGVHQFWRFWQYACLLFTARLSLFGLQNCYISFCILQSHCYLFKIVSVLLFCQKLSLCWYFVQNCPCFCCKNHNARALSDLRCFCCNLYLAKSFCHFQPAV